MCSKPRPSQKCTDTKLLLRKLEHWRDGSVTDISAKARLQETQTPIPQLLVVAATRRVGERPGGLLARAVLAFGENLQDDGENALENHGLDLDEVGFALVVIST